jgi:hypothetical protein
MMAGFSQDCGAMAVFGSCQPLKLALRETRLWHKHLLNMTAVLPARRKVENN